MRHGLWACVALAAAVTAAPCLAFQVTSVPTNADRNAKFTDPDNLTDSMANDLSGGTGGTLHFGSTSVTMGVSNGAGSSGLSPALQQRLMLGPNAVGTGAQLH